MSKTFWDRTAFVYDIAESLNNRAYAGMLAEIAALIPPGARVLECAAGTGQISLTVAPKAQSVLCTDLSLPMLAQARQKAAKRGLKNITFAQRDLLALPEDDGSFDIVIAANVIHLLDDPQAALLGLWRVVKAGGALIVPTFLTKESKKGFPLLIKVYRLLGFRPASNFSAADYRALLDKCGLSAPSLKIIEGLVPLGFAVFRKEGARP